MRLLGALVLLSSLATGCDDSAVDQEYCKQIHQIVIQQEISESDPSVADDVKACTKAELW